MEQKKHVPFTKKYLEIDEAKEIILDNPKELSQIIDFVDSYHYCTERGLLGCLMESGDIDMLKWFMQQI